MADESTVVRGIDWRATFPFTQIFRSFRIAIHPSKLVLALLALLLVYTGGRFLDAIWPVSYRAAPGEMVEYEQARKNGLTTREFINRRDAVRDTLRRQYDSMLRSIGKQDGSVADLEWRINHDRETARKDIGAAYDKSDHSAAAAKTRDDAIKSVYEGARDAWNVAHAVDGVGLFRTLYDYELGQVNAMVRSVRRGDWLSDTGVADALVKMVVVGPSWAMRHHWVYFTIYGLYFLVVWSIFGGAISRIAAVHVARDEKISIRQALGFSVAKFLSFISAPI
ncbi:MAG: hypothetical protein ACREJC_12155, partial [Tepidisphaeraceae bacterium]